MISYVLDASALLVLLKGEAGSEQVIYDRSCLERFTSRCNSPTNSLIFLLHFPCIVLTEEQFQIYLKDYSCVIVVLTKGRIDLCATCS